MNPEHKYSTARFKYEELASRLRRIADDVLRSRPYPDVIRRRLHYRMRNAVMWWENKADGIDPRKFRAVP